MEEKMMKRIESISKVLQAGKIRYEINLCPSFSFMWSGTQHQYCDSVSDLYQLTKEIVYCDGQ